MWRDSFAKTEYSWKNDSREENRTPDVTTDRILNAFARVYRRRLFGAFRSVKRHGLVTYVYEQFKTVRVNNDYSRIVKKKKIVPRLSGRIKESLGPL